MKFDWKRTDSITALQSFYGKMHQRKPAFTYESRDCMIIEIREDIEDDAHCGNKQLQNPRKN